ncbi:hypothetical protein RHGRI_009819 [Rhododendron griersonianum]|uniref:non-specific serine/threonine protein kinase n=1 Tax=Rhododendron griersonianum TaxID=479676 RepID=A0AAV6KGY6_9ERIC|nr:hypothetical protein RHGRI_009819 [Rhododendron griersonianum]
MRIFPRNFASLAIGIVISFTTFASAAPRLPPDEVAALKEIGKTLGKTGWNFSVDPCTTFSTVTVERIELFRVSIGFENSVNCTCNDTVCHITRIALKAQDLQGTLPPELVRLTHLKDIDLTRNYINGTIPLEWGSMMKLEQMYVSPVLNLLGNRLTGPIPKELANINTLITISLEFNQLSGPIPPELGSLPLLEKLHLTSNYFTGELPKELAKLTTLKDFRISSNNFIGKIPDFIKNWVDLTRLDIQGSGLDGPIPPGIGLLTKLSDLRISDLNGSQASFPPLNNLTSLKNLFLRSCNITGTLPEYLGTMTKLEILDLSFNNLSGEIPSNLSSLSKIEMMYLTGNLLSGPVHPWMLDTSKNMSFHDMSQNLKTWSSFHINCGGKEVTLDGNNYEIDGDESGPSNYYRSTTTNWAFSSTGNFMDDGRSLDPFMSTDSSRLSVNNSDLYAEARISPISLTYYGFCLVKGNYNITLHFAEIMFNDSKSYSSLGRRIFDIYIQLVEKDFNIVDAAGGIGKGIIKPYAANVTDDGTLEIRLYWAGKGTTGLPVRGVYGPLISAISVDNPNYEPPKGISVGAVALVLKQKGNMMELVDPKLGSDFNKIEVTGMINVALMCTNVSPAVRPAMSSVVSMLEGRTVPETSSVSDPDASNEQMKLKGMMIELQKSLETDTSEGQVQIVSTDGPFTASSASAGDLYPNTASSASAGDLYPLNWDSKVLENRTVEFNQLSGSIPQELGSLPLLEKLHLTSNYITGELPKELATLTTLKDLAIVGSGLDGPIPPGIGLLTKLSDLRISDLNGSQASFPPLNNLTRLKTLILRSCNINGKLPEYLGTMTNLTLLLSFIHIDLSFNNLSGKIPSYFNSLSKIEMILVSMAKSRISACNAKLGAKFNEIVFNWELAKWTCASLDAANYFKKHKSVDGLEQYGAETVCTDGGFKLNVEVKEEPDVAGVDGERSSFHINCGGKEVSLDGNKYEGDDEDPGVPSKFYRSATNWMFSSTGNFIDDGRPLDLFISTNSSRLHVNNSDLYMDARISPISLTYYLSCLVKGNYNITLHFAEIMFNDSKSYGSLGRRIFDIYIQEKLVQKDFNIVDEAGGIGKEIKKNYTEVVTDGTLVIRLYWAGKGTTGLPVRGVYGPLISAISVHNPDYEPPPKGISASAVVGIVAAAAFVIILLLDLKGLDLQTGSYTLRQIKAATDNFDEANKIGEGGFGSVYKALVLKQKGNMMELVDPKLGLDFNKIEVTGMINIALLCTNVSPAVRPTMSLVVSMLEGRTVPETLSVLDPDASNEQMKLNGMMIELQKSLETDTSEGKIQIVSTDGPYTASSASAGDLYPNTASSASGGDLYPLNWDSKVLENRFRRTSQLNIRVVCAASSAAGSSSPKATSTRMSPVVGFEVVNEAYARKHKDAQERRDEATAAQVSKYIKYADKQPIVPWWPRLSHLESVECSSEFGGSEEFTPREEEVGLVNDVEEVDLILPQSSEFGRDEEFTARDEREEEVDPLVIEGGVDDGLVEPSELGANAELTAQCSPLESNVKVEPPLISLLGNRLTGPIPKELAKIRTPGMNFEFCRSVEFNQLSGSIPPELGSLPLLEKLDIDLSYNNFSFGTSQDCQLGRM